MINIAICDDSKSDTRDLEQMISEIIKDDSFSYFVETYYSGKELMENWKSFDIVFLDIDMNNESGISVGLEIKRKYFMTRIIYVTSYTSYYEEAFSVHAFQYIVKPIEVKSVQSIFFEAVTYINNHGLQNMVSIDTNGEITNLSLQNIYYFEFIDRKVKIVSNNGESFIRVSLKSVYDKVHNANFAIPHKAFIINLFQIKRIKGNSILMSNKEMLPIAQKRAASFKKEYFDFLNEVYKML